jgi:2-polyprenyl-3-methyl-5-hydroxy-6-metoxy-1,4-benzoquinol methylase
MSNYSASHFDKANENMSWYKVFYLIEPGSSVLDVGCSSGNFGAALIEFRNCQVDGVEIAPDDIAEASTKLGHVFNLDVERDELTPITKHYDVIYFGDVVEHLIHPTNVLEKVSKLLKPGGRVLFSVPNMAHISVRLDLLAGRFEYTNTGLLDNTHLHYYDRVEIERVFGEAGYKLATLDFVSKDYPRQIIEETLGELGLTANERFYELMASPEASAFQWIGAASYTGHKMKVERRIFGPVDKFEILINEVNASHDTKVEDLNRKIHALNITNGGLQERIDEIRQHPLRSAARHLKKRLGRD